MTAAPATHASDLARSGGASLLDVPDAEPIGRGGSILEMDLSAGFTKGRNPVYSISPMALAIGMPYSELALSVREGGQPGDGAAPVSRIAAAVKFHLMAGTNRLPSLALQVSADRLATQPALGAQALAAIRPLQGLRIALSAGVAQREESSSGIGPVGGLAVGAQLGDALELAVSGFASSASLKLATSLQWAPVEWFRVALVLQRVLADNVNQAVLTLSLVQPGAKRVAPQALALEDDADVSPRDEASSAQALGERPLLRLRISPRSPLPDAPAPVAAPASAPPTVTR